eukprot:3257141-Rhodomonas_salina.2
MAVSAMPSDFRSSSRYRPTPMRSVRANLARDRAFFGAKVPFTAANSSGVLPCRGSANVRLAGAATPHPARQGAHRTRGRPGWMSTAADAGHDGATSDSGGGWMGMSEPSGMGEKRLAGIIISYLCSENTMLKLLVEARGEGEDGEGAEEGGGEGKGIDGLKQRAHGMGRAAQGMVRRVEYALRV